MMQAPLYVTVKNCARCRREHVELRFDIITGHDKYTHWALCPVRKEPILMMVCFDE